MNRTIMGAETEYLLSFHRLRRGDADRIGPHSLVELAMQEPHLLAEEAGLFLPNGGRLYADPTGHIEFCTPECGTPGELVRYIRAGNRLVSRLVQKLQATLPHVESLLSATNVDDGGNTWGFHENYLIRRPIECYDKTMQNFLPTRLIYGGAGGLDPLSSGVVFSLSPRSRHITRVSSHSSTEQRPLFHLKDEPLSAEYGRLHLLCGEALNSDFGLRLRFGATALILRLIDCGEDPSEGIELLDPLRALRIIALDPTGTQPVDTRSGPMTAVALQKRYLAHVIEGLGRSLMPDWAPEIVQDWGQTLDRLENDPQSLEGILDWTLKKRLFDTIAEEIYGLNGEAIQTVNQAITDFRGRRRSATIGSQTVRRLVALQEKEGQPSEDLLRVVALRRHLLETDIRFSQPDDGYFAELDRTGQLSHQIPEVDEAGIAQALGQPPPGGRAEIRGKFVQEHSHQTERYAVGWMRVADRENGAFLNLENPFETLAQWRTFMPLPEEFPETASVAEPPPPIYETIGQLHTRGVETERRGDLRGAEAFYRETQDLAQENDHREMETHCRWHIAVLCEKMGRWGEARALVEPILIRDFEDTEKDFRLHYQASLMIELRLAVRMGENLPILERVMERVLDTLTGAQTERRRRSDQDYERRLRTELDSSRAELLLRRGRPDEALVLLRNQRETDASYALRVRAYLMRQDMAQAEFTLQQWKVNGMMPLYRPVYYTLLAETHIRRQELRQAVRAARKALTEAEIWPSAYQAQAEAALNAHLTYARALISNGRGEQARKSVDFVLNHEALQDVQLQYEAKLLDLDCELAEAQTCLANNDGTTDMPWRPGSSCLTGDIEGARRALRYAQEVYTVVAFLGHTLDESLDCNFRHEEIAERHRQILRLQSL